MKLQTGTVSIEMDTTTGESYQSVPFTILADDDAVLQEKIQAMPLAATKDEIVAMLTQALAVYKENAARFVDTSVHQAALDNASVVAGEISNLSIE